MAGVGQRAVCHGWITIRPAQAVVSIVEALVLVEVKYHQHFHRAQEPWSPVVPDRVRSCNVATRASRPGRSRQPRPVPVGAGLAGGVLAVRVADLVVADAAGGAELLAPGPVGPVRDGDLVAWCTVVAVTPAVFDENGRIGADGWLPDHVRLGGAGRAPGRRRSGAGRRQARAGPDPARAATVDVAAAGGSAGPGDDPTAQRVLCGGVRAAGRCAAPAAVAARLAGTGVHGGHGVAAGRGADEGPVCPRRRSPGRRHRAGPLVARAAGRHAGRLPGQDPRQ